MAIDLTNKKAFLILGALVLFAASFFYWDRQLLQYLFFLRVPLFTGVLLFTLPVICMYWLPTMLGNLFVMGNFLRIALVIPGAVAVGLGVVLIGAVIGANAQARFGVEASPWFDSLANGSSILPYFLAILLSLPTTVAVYWSSGPNSGEMSESSRRNGTILGTLLSALFLGAVYWLRKDRLSEDVFSSLLMQLFKWLPGQAQRGYLTAANRLAAGHEVMASYLLVATVLYFVGLYFYRPSLNKEKWELPALSYVLGLLQIFSLLVGFWTFFLDLYRVPVLLSMLLFSALAYRLWKVDHYYTITKATQHPITEQELAEALKKRLQGEETLVVVCASGGGIQAAGWTTRVLVGLQDVLGIGFTRAIGLVSSVSGGSVGAMYFLDRLNEQGFIEPDKLQEVFHASTKDSLSATGWGLVYPDLWRIVGIPYLKTQPADRGDAINTDWKSELVNKQSTLLGLSQDIKSGLKPVPVFNATLVEDGRHYLLSPLTFGVKEELSVEFNTLYPGLDIDLSTAALLSATFPYVTPITRNSLKPSGKPVFHVADGGFFDNFGVVTAVDWLENLVLPQRESIGIKRVLFVEIRAFPDVGPLKTAKDKSDVGWKMALIGPLLTIFNARNSTQAQRNGALVKNLKNAYQGKVEILDYQITFPKNVEFFAMPLMPKSTESQYQPPLSWTLTRRQREAIDLAWERLAHSAVVTDLRRAWQSKG